jgi:uncharacterized protein YcgI (DUF1989 family)
MASEIVEVPARHGAAVRVPKGQSVKLVNTRGSQVVDTWAFSAEDLTEHMSMEHTRVMLGKLNPKRGDQLFSSRRRPLLLMAEDTTAGVHDTLRAACDPVRYRMLGFSEHASCQANLIDAMAALGLKPPHLPCPLNMFEACPVASDGTLEVVPPPVKAGEYVVLEALIDTVVVFSACPMDVFPTNGRDRTVKPVAYQLLPARG